MKRRLIFLIMCLSFISTGAQNWVKLMENPQINFYTIQKEFYREIQEKSNENKHDKKEITHSTIATKENEEQEEGSFQLFKRWENYMAPRVYPSGERTLASKSYEEFQKYLNNIPSAKNQTNVNAVTSSSWNALGPFGNPVGHNVGRINCIRFDPTNNAKMWAGSPAGGLWNSTNNAASWSIKNASLDITGCADVAIDPNNSNIIFLATGDADGSDTYSIGVYKSTDGGLTWNTTGLNWSASQGYKVPRLLVNPNNSLIVLAATNSGLQRSADGGVTWNQVSTLSAKDMEFKPGDPNTVYAAGTSFIKSTDAGQTWTTITSGIPVNPGRLAIAVTEADPTYVYLLASDNAAGAFLGFSRSTNSGASFTITTSTPNMLGYAVDGSDASGQGWYDLSIDASPVNKNEVMIGGVQVWKSTDGGSTFTCKTQWYGGFGYPYCHADVHGIEYQNADTVWVACDGGVFMTPDAGTSWGSHNGLMNISQFYSIGLSASNANLIVGGLQDNSSVMMNGSTWSRMLSTGDGFVSFIDKNNNNIMYTSSYTANLSRSSDGGNTWAGITTGLPAGPWKTDWSHDPNITTTLYAGLSEMFKSTNSGSNWTQLTATGVSGDIVKFQVAPSNTQTIYVAKYYNVLKSIDGGTTWTDITGSLPTSSAQLTWVEVDPTNANNAWVSFSGYSAGNKVFATTNGGASWTNISSGLPNIPANCMAFSKGTNGGIYLGMDIGVYYIDGTMTSWIPYFTGLPNTIVSDLRIFSPTGKLRAGTYGRGTWECDLYNPETLLPIANFTANQTIICAPSSVNFTDISTFNPTSWNWTFQGGNPATSTMQNPTINYTTPGTYAVSLTASNTNGSNTLSQTSYITVSGINNLPLQEGFVTSVFPPVNWTIKNINNDSVFWKWAPNAGSQGSASSMVFDNYNMNANGLRDEMQTPKYDFSTVTSPTLKFDVAYILYSNKYLDSLAVLVSADCGVTFNTIYLKGGSSLASVTGQDTTGVFIPNGPSQWRTETVNLNSYAGQGNVMLSFQNRGHYGQAIYVDNINISNTTAIIEYSNSQSVELYPNPNNGIFELHINNMDNSIYLIEIRDILGQLVYRENLKSNSQEYIKIINLMEKAKGIYNISVQSESMESVQKSSRRIGYYLLNFTI